MYRQVLVDKEQTSLQSILWREDPEDELHEFELLTVTYDTKSASFLAVRCLHQLAEIEKINYPRAAELYYVTISIWMIYLLTQRRKSYS